MMDIILNLFVMSDYLNQIKNIQKIFYINLSLPSHYKIFFYAISKVDYNYITVIIIFEIENLIF